MLFDFSLKLPHIRLAKRRNQKPLSNLTSASTTNPEIFTLARTIDPKLLIEPERYKNFTVTQELQILKIEKRGKMRSFPEATKVQMGA
jgi:hypothetical protein